MSEPAAKPAAKPEAAVEYVLPASLVGESDIARLIREVETVDGDLQAQKVRGAKSLHMPPMSQALADFVETNKINIADGQQLTDLKQRLRKMKDHIPVVHLTFATSVDPYELQKLVMWLRTEIHPQALISVGLQPSLIGGVYLRTPNHIHDFSVKALLKDKRGIMQQELEKLRAG